ncbi:hypothetical protein GCM10010401_08880 [Rarobacter faecitabidus]|uniref:Uncharacterized protein n=1 Tax=Rarobacter faecitabidus TaxID=13243 RepID=A0A542ZAW7_RARFA|nr:hypothetical protein [Rarobacter faecitabidus]TQL57489.1 hypothetical protein FB461_2226 [Rarobacter faecitabidus]
MTITGEAIAAVRRHYADRSDRVQAGAELLIRDGKAIYPGAPWLAPIGNGLVIDTALLTFESGAWSSGEQALTRIAVGLIDCTHLDSTDIARLDRRQLHLVLAAVAHSAGSHHDTDIEHCPDGSVTLTHPPTLMDWPTADPVQGATR